MCDIVFFPKYSTLLFMSGFLFFDNSAQVFESISKNNFWLHLEGSILQLKPLLISQ